jgi:hypothetical protein
MSTSSKTKLDENKEISKPNGKPTSIAIAQNGINVSGDVKRLTAALACDVIAGLVPPSNANAACNAIGKLLKTVEMEYKFGRQLASGERTLALTGSNR